MSENINKLLLIKIMQKAYSGELAAAYAYRGHWKALRNLERKNCIRKIEEEEWHHRKQVGEILKKLNSRPKLWYEIKATIIGRFLGLFCWVLGWLIPIYGAGKLESKNIKEYVDAATYARDGHLQEFVECLLTMAEVEWEHENYLRSEVIKHTIGRKIPIWPEPPPKIKIRSFEA